MLGVIRLVKGLQGRRHDRVALAEEHMNWVLEVFVLVLHLLHDHVFILQLWLKLVLSRMVHHRVFVVALGLQHESRTHLHPDLWLIHLELLFIFENAEIVLGVLDQEAGVGVIELRIFVRVLNSVRDGIQRALHVPSGDAS